MGIFRNWKVHFVKKWDSFSSETGKSKTEKKSVTNEDVRAEEGGSMAGGHRSKGEGDAG